MTLTFENLILFDHYLMVKVFNDLFNFFSQTTIYMVWLIC